MAKSRPPRGRPPVASRELIQEAALELFLEQGYEATTVAHIAQRAGVSRSTFFNHFASKADVFCTELDDAVTVVERVLAASERREFVAVRDALLAAAQTFGPERVPLALTQHELIGSAVDLQSAAGSRLARLGGLVAQRLREDGVSPGHALAAAYALVGASIAAARTWASAGVGRGGLEGYLLEATGPVFRGFGES